MNAFFFARIDARGFGLMRVLWGFIAFVWMGTQWADVTEFYSDAGVIPHAMEPLFLRSDYRFTLLEWVSTPDAVFTLYILMLLSFLCMMVGWIPRLSTILSVILLFSFHERNPLPFGGGDTVLRLLGAMLVVAPRIDAFSVKRLGQQWGEWRISGRLLPATTMAIWPYRLLLWQFIVLYGTSLWFKLMGTMWKNGTAVASALHHPVFARFPKVIMDVLTPFMPVVDFATLAWHATWLLLLIPKPLIDRIVPHSLLKRAILVGGLLFHGFIFIFMDAGSFSLAVFSGYLGLLLAEDFDAIRGWMNQRWKIGQGTRDKGQQRSAVTCPMSPVTVLYDGRCAFCQRSIFVLQILDHLRRLSFVNFYDTAKRKEVAPEISLEDLKKAMHVIVPMSHVPCPMPHAGFDAFRALSWHAPILWPVAPLLYVPGIPTIGRMIYGLIARKRHGMTK